MVGIARRRVREEDGGSVAEAAIAVPLIVVFFVVSLQLGVHLFSISSLQAQIQDAAVEIDLSALPSGSGQAALDEAVKKALVEQSLGIDAERLSVSESSVDLETRSETASVDPKGTQAGTIESTVTTARLKARVEYSTPSLLGEGGFGKALVQNVDVVQTVSSRAEVGDDAV